MHSVINGRHDNFEIIQRVRLCVSWDGDVGGEMTAAARRTQLWLIYIYLILSATAHARTHAPHRIRGALHTHLYNTHGQAFGDVHNFIGECVFGSSCTTATATTVRATGREKEKNALCRVSI